VAVAFNLGVLVVLEALAAVGLEVVLVLEPQELLIQAVAVAVEITPGQVAQVALVWSLFLSQLFITLEPQQAHQP
jgi:hypothetical protein